MILSLYIINKSGGLIYQRDFETLPQLRGNEYLRLGSTFHSLHAISTQIAPAFGAHGIQQLEADTFDLHCFQTTTGLKFFVLVSKGTSNARQALQDMYRLYADYALKNPFYEVDMPIRCELFDKNLERMVKGGV